MMLIVIQMPLIFFSECPRDIQPHNVAVYQCSSHVMIQVLQCGAPNVVTVPT